tara:strand:+ start:33 stop:491 length:459 start_codon:yes stop_codon:yes gene_type:complete
MEEYKKNHYNINVAWEDVIKKIESEFIDNTHALQVSGPRDRYPKVGIICYNDKLFGTLQDAVDIISPDLKKNYKSIDVDTYISFSKDSCVHDRHCDDKDVLIVQAIGRMEYRFDNMKSYILDQGDSIFIPVGVYHTPIVHSARCTLSFGLRP